MNNSDGVQLTWKGKRKPELKDVHFKLIESCSGLIEDNNLLFFGENKEVLMYLFTDYKEKIDLIYIDPPFATGETFKHKIKISDGSWTIIDNFIEKKAYDDTWGKKIDVYLQMLYERIYLMHHLLSKKGSIFVHIDRRVSSYVKLMLDEIFGKENFLNEIIWNYVTPGYPKDRFAQKHDTIYWYAKSKGKHVFNLDEVRTPYDEARKKKATKDKDGNLVYVHGPGFGVTKLHPKGRITDDVWKIALVNSMARERTTYPTQKPLELIERIIKAASNPGDLIADFFIGSGTTSIAASKLNRKWIGVDNSFLAINTVKKRLLDKNLGFSIFSIKDLNEMQLKNKKITYNFKVQKENNTIILRFQDYMNEEIINKLKERKLKLDLPKDLIDFWGVDFNFNNIFELEWASYKTRNKSEIDLNCSFTYENKGNKKIKIKFIDIFNNYFEKIIEISL